jgi:hypothetical protein
VDGNRSEKPIRPARRLFGDGDASGLVHRLLAGTPEIPGKKGCLMTDNTVTRPDDSKTVDIGICTYRRPALIATLLSLFELEVPEGVKVRLIVADNDEESIACAKPPPSRLAMSIARNRIFRLPAMPACRNARRIIWPSSMMTRPPRRIGSAPFWKRPMKPVRKPFSAR